MPTPVAPLISGWQRRVGGMPGPYSAMPATGVASGGTGVSGLLVELLVDGSWVDITKRTMVRDNSGQITIARGQSSEGQQPNPGTCNLTLNNRDGLFSPRNALSPYYGKIGRNTQLRVSVMKGDDKSYRFWGEVAAWPEDWDVTNTDIWVDVEAAGILRRLSQGQTPLGSTMYRGITSAATAPPVAYWPCEDGSASSSLASALGGQPMRIIGTPSLAADSGFACSAALPTLSGAQFVGQVPAYSATGQTQFRFLLYVPTAPADGTQLVRIATTGSAAYWAVAYATGGGLKVVALDTDGFTVLANSGGLGFGIDNARLYVSLSLTQNGGNVDWLISTNTTSASGTNFLSGTFPSLSVGRVTSVSASPGQTLTDSVIGHISIQSAVTSPVDLAGQASAFIGETVTARLGRLCGEQGVNYVRLGTPPLDTMGPQLPNNFLNLIQECVDVDQGVLFERETAFGLAYRTRNGLYNLAAPLTLSYPGHQLAATPKPVPDDQMVRNQVTASRQSGSSATYTLPTGPLSVKAPPLGVGLYPDSVTLNVNSDNDLANRAAWRVHLGTVDEPRYPAISVHLANPAMAPARVAALNVIFGNRIAVANPPSRLGGDISQIVIGIQETITHFEHRITYVCQPETPYRVGTVEDPVYRVDSAASILAADLTPTQTSAQVNATDGFLWTTDASSAPFNITVAGEVMRVDAVGSILNANPFLDTDASNWTAQSGAVGWSTDFLQPYGAPGALLITPDGVSASGGALATRSATGTVTPGASYTACLWAYSPGGWSDLRACADWYDASGTFLSSSLGSGSAVAAGTWTFLTQTLTAPASASSAVVRARHGGTPAASSTWYAWGIRLIPVIAVPSAPQSFQVTRAVNGVTKAHQAAESVSLTNPAIVAL